MAWLTSGMGVQEVASLMTSDSFSCATGEREPVKNLVVQAMQTKFPGVRFKASTRAAGDGAVFGWVEALADGSDSTEYRRYTAALDAAGRAALASMFRVGSNKSD